MNKKYFQLGVVLVALCLAFSACKKCYDETDPECENYDPCWDKPATSADFTMYETFVFTLDDGFKYETDTFCGDTQRILFKATQEGMSSYKWLMGSEIEEREGDSLFLHFSRDRVPPHGTIDIRLAVSNDVDKNCHPNDKGVDTIVHQITLLPDSASLMIGKYEGYMEDTPDEVYQIAIEFLDSVGTSGIRFDGYYIRNFTNVEKGRAWPPVAVGLKVIYKHMWFGQGIYMDINETQRVEIKELTGILSDNEKDLVIEFRQHSNGNESLNLTRRFIGRKIE